MRFREDDPVPGRHSRAMIVHFHFVVGVDSEQQIMLGKFIRDLLFELLSRSIAHHHQLDSRAAYVLTVRPTLNRP